MARVTLPESKVRARRRRRRAWLAAALVLLVCSLVGGLIYLARAPFLTILTIEVSGSKSVSPEMAESVVQEILASSYLSLFPKRNVLLYPKSALAAALLARYPSLRSVNVSAKDFNTLEVSLIDREPFALWCPLGPVVEESSPCLFLDLDGVAYAPSPIFSGTPYVTYQGALTGEALPKRFLSPGQFRALVALVAALSGEEPGNPVRQVVVEEGRDVRAYFQNDFVLIFSLKDDTGDIFQRFELARGAEPFVGRALSDFEYLDLRWGEKMYYKLKEQ